MEIAVEFDNGKIIAGKPVSTPVVGSMAQIIEMIEDEQTPLADISRKIALEIARVAGQANDADFLTRGNTSRKDLNEQVKMLLSLQRTLDRSDALNKRDILNLDGPKFRFMLGELVLLFKKSMEESGIPPEMVRSARAHFGELIHTNDDKFRRELANMDKVK